MRAYELGARFDEWGEKLDFPLWQEAFAQTGIDPDFYVTRRRGLEEVFPWDHLFVQMKKDFLWTELEAARELAETPDCSTHKCTDCGICDFREVKNVNYHFEPSTGEVHAHSTRGRRLKNEPTQRLNQPKEAPAIQESLKTLNKKRVQYTKLGEAAYLSHLDLMTVLRRALARSRIPIGFSKGFHPQMLLSMGPASPLGQESEAEYLDIEFVQDMSSSEFRSRMNAALPKGIDFQRVWEIPKNTPSLNGTLREQAYDIELNFLETQDIDLSEKVARLNRSSELPVVRQRPKKQCKTIDIRPMIKNLSVTGPNRLHLVTRFGPTKGGVKPVEVLDALWVGDKPAGLWSRIRKIDSVFSESIAK